MKPQLTQRREEAKAQSYRYFLLNYHRVFATLRLCVFLTVIVTAGCVSKTKAKLEAQQAYIAGQQHAMMTMKQDSNSVQVRGNVKNTVVPWTEDLTLAKAILAAEYQGHHDPNSILIIRNGAGTEIQASDLLNGHDEPLQPGDLIEIR